MKKGTAVLCISASVIVDAALIVFISLFVLAYGFENNYAGEIVNRIMKAEPYVQVAVQTVCDPWDDDNEVSYWTIFDNGILLESEPFTAEDTIDYRVSYDCFESYIDKQRNKVLNRLNKIEICDREGRVVPYDEAIEKIFYELEEFEHNMSDIRILKSGSEIFVYVELNVNWQCPGDLYRYDADKNELINIGSWQHSDLIALKAFENEEI